MRTVTLKSFTVKTLAINFALALLLMQKNYIKNMEQNVKDSDVLLVKVKNHNELFAATQKWKKRSISPQKRRQS